MTAVSEHLKQIKRLIIALTISGILNIFLLVLSFYWIIKESPPTPYCESKPISHQANSELSNDNSNAEVNRKFRQLTFEQLVAKLSDTHLVENGYAQRDLALASLVAFHYFDLDRALGYGKPLQQRTLTYGKYKDGTPAKLIVYPGLTDEQFRSVIRFAQTERWPLIPKGLFFSLKKQSQTDLSLEDAFFLTPEFLTVETLFTRAGVPVKKSELLSVLLQGTWQILAKFAQEQKIEQDLSPARRRRFLLNYVALKSKNAAYLMLRTDPIFALKQLDDQQILGFLELLENKSKTSKNFALSLLVSPRSDAVRQKASEKLYEFADEPKPDNFQYQTALQRFVPDGVKPTFISVAKADPPLQTSKSKQTTMTMPSTSPVKNHRIYIVQEGDSLWKIARRFNMDVETLKKTNQLQSDLLKTGKILKLPE